MVRSFVRSLKNWWLEIFPFPWDDPGALAYADKRLNDPVQQENINELNRVAAATRDEIRLKELRDLAKSKKDDEDRRQDSILARAQGLFVALALFSVLFTFGANLQGQTTKFSDSMLVICILIVIYLLIQIVGMVVNILKSIGAIEYPTAGSSDLARFMSCHDIADHYRDEALLTLRHYRQTSLYNSWRFQRLVDAWKGLRNIVITLSILTLMFWMFALCRS
jgi:hypothetical protein